MPVVLQSDLDAYKSQQVQDYAASLRSRDAASSTNDASLSASTAAPAVDAPAAALPPTPDAPLVAPAGMAQPPAPVSAAPQDSGFHAALDWGNQQIGKGYVWGSAGGRSDLSGNAPGYDCSGFVSQFYHQMGRSVPAQTSAAYAATTHLDQADAQPGDIVEFNMGSNDPHEQHIAIYLGNGKIMQSGGTRHDVNIGDVNQFGAGSFEFRRAAGGPSDSSTTRAIDHVATAAQTATGTSDSGVGTAPPNDAFQGMPAAAPDAPADSPITSAYAYAASLPGAVADTAGKAWNSATDYAASLMPKPSVPDAGSPGDNSMTAAQQPTPSDSLTNPVAPPPAAPNGFMSAAGDAISGASAQGQSTGDPNLPFGGHTPFDLATDYSSRVMHEPLDGVSNPGVVIGMEGAAEGAGKIAGNLAGKVVPDTIEGLQGWLNRAASHPEVDQNVVAAKQAQLADLQQAAAPAASAASPDIMQGMLDLLKQSGQHDPAQIDALQGQIDAIRGPSEVPAAAPDSAPAPTDITTPGNPLLTGKFDPATGRRIQDDAPVTASSAPPRIDTGPGSRYEDIFGTDTGAPSTPPAEHYDPETEQWVTDKGPAQPHSTSAIANQAVRDVRTVSPSGALEPGSANIPGKQGGAVPPNGKVPGKIASANPSGEPPPPLPEQSLPRRITPEMMQDAHEQINTSPNATPDSHDELDALVQGGASPGEIARFMAKIKGDKVTLGGVARTVRTGSMAGGDTTEAKVLLSPVIQTAMRGPVGALKAIVQGHPEDIAKGMHGGLAGLADGAYDGLQTILHGVSDRAALGGGKSSMGFSPGIDVLGRTPLQRALGTAAIGLVRTHGAASDVAAGIGRGAALATGASREAAEAVGQQWAMRSGTYGTVGAAVDNALRGIRSVNPALDVTGQILVPFYRIGYNVATQGIEHSPVGLVGTAADVARSKLPASAPGWLKGPYAAGNDASKVTPLGDRLYRNMFGVGLASLGLAEASQGNITGEHPTGGDPKWSVKVAGNWMPLRFLGPGGEALAQSAIRYESARDDKGDVARTAGLSAGAYVGHVGDETWLRGVGDIFQMIGDAGKLGGQQSAQAAHDIQYTATNIGKSFIPQEKLGEQIGGAITGNSPQPSSGGSAYTRPTRASVVPPRPSVRAKP